MSEWKSVSIREIIADAIDKIVKEAVNPDSGLPKWDSRCEFIEEAIEEKLARAKEVKKK